MTIDALHGYRPWARRLMQTRCWWLVLVLHALFSLPVILLVNAAGMLRECLRESVRDYAWGFSEVILTRAAVVRAKKWKA